MALTAQDLDLGKLLDASQQSPRSFAEAIADAVRSLAVDSQVIVAISDQDGKVYRVKGGAGVPHAPVEVVRLATAEERSDKKVYYRHEVPPSIAELFDVHLAEHLGFYVSLEAPQLVSVQRSSRNEPLLIIAVALRDKDDRNAVAEILQRNVSALGRLYNAALDQLKLRLRELLVSEANRSRDLGSLLFRASKLAQQELDIDRVIAIAPDESGMVLNVRAVHPRPGGLDLSSHSIPRNLASATPVLTAFTMGKTFAVRPADLEHALQQLTPPLAREAAIVPLQPMTPSEDKAPVGVLVCIGKSWRIGGETFGGTFVWEDVALLEFFADMLSILTRMLRSRDEAAFRVERVLHGAKTIFGSIHNNLALLEECGVSATFAPELEYVLTDSIALLGDISSQLERKRLSSLTEISRSDEVRVYGDVLAPAAKFAVSLARATGRHELRVSSLQEARFRQVPILVSNQNAVATVFRNLIHNAVKYSGRQPTDEPWLDFSWRTADGWLVVAVSDNGIGIGEDERELVFVEGYRSRMAMKVDPTGIGVGLSDCREIMSLLGGLIAVVDPQTTSFGQACTTIEVRFPLTSPTPISS